MLASQGLKAAVTSYPAAQQLILLLLIIAQSQLTNKAGLTDSMTVTGTTVATASMMGTAETAAAADVQRTAHTSAAPVSAQVDPRTGNLLAMSQGLTPGATTEGLTNR